MTLDEREFGEFGRTGTESATSVDVRVLGAEALIGSSPLKELKDLAKLDAQLVGPRIEDETLRDYLEQMEQIELIEGILGQLPAAHANYVEAVKANNARYPDWSVGEQTIVEEFGDIASFDPTDPNKLFMAKDSADIAHRLTSDEIAHRLAINTEHRLAIEKYDKFQSSHRLPVEGIEAVEKKIKDALADPERLESIMQSAKSGQEFRLVLALPLSEWNEAAAITEASLVGGDYKNLPPGLFAEDDSRYKPDRLSDRSPVIALVETTPRLVNVNIEDFTSYAAGREAADSYVEALTFSAWLAYAKDFPKTDGSPDAIRAQFNETRAVIPSIRVGRLGSFSGVDAEHQEPLKPLIEGGYEQPLIDKKYALRVAVINGVPTLGAELSVKGILYGKREALPMKSAWYMIPLS